jgi:CPA2 family monovalent cation:H+ antiporter-2
LLTIALTPAAFWIAPRLDRVLARAPLLGRLFAPRVETPLLPDELHDHAIVVGYGRVGRRMARGLRQAGLKVVVIDQEIELVRELNSRGATAIYGDASYEIVLGAARPAAARVIVVALPDFGATRAVVHRARRSGSDALIVARAQRSENDARLREAGATAVVVPENAGALMLLEETLILLGLPHDHIFTGIAPLATMRESVAEAIPDIAQQATPQAEVEQARSTA